jgi:hypothetical protein
MLHSAPLNLSILLGSLAILTVTLLLWPVSWLLRRSYGRPPESRELRRLRLLIGVAVIVQLLYAAAWVAWLTPVLSVELWVYSSRHDAAVRTLQLAGLLAIAAAAVGIWALWRSSRLQSSRMLWMRNAVLAAALLGIVWIGFLGHLFSFNLNY